MDIDFTPSEVKVTYGRKGNNMPTYYRGVARATKRNPKRATEFLFNDISVSEESMDIDPEKETSLLAVESNLDSKTTINRKDLEEFFSKYTLSELDFFVSQIKKSQNKDLILSLPSEWSLEKQMQFIQDLSRFQIYEFDNGFVKSYKQVFLNKDQCREINAYISSELDENQKINVFDNELRRKELNGMMMSALKMILKNYNSKVSGNKNELIERILKIENEEFQQQFSLSHQSSTTESEISLHSESSDLPLSPQKNQIDSDSFEVPPKRSTSLLSPTKPSTNSSIHAFSPIKPAIKERKIGNTPIKSTNGMNDSYITDMNESVEILDEKESEDAVSKHLDFEDSIPLEDEETPSIQDVATMSTLTIPTPAPPVEEEDDSEEDSFLECIHTPLTAGKKRATMIDRRRQSLAYFTSNPLSLRSSKNRFTLASRLSLRSSILNNDYINPYNNLEEDRYSTVSQRHTLRLRSLSFALPTFIHKASESSHTSVYEMPKPKPSSEWMTSLFLSQVFDYLPLHDLLANKSLVCSTWHMVVHRNLSWKMALEDDSDAFSLFASPNSLLQVFPHGREIGAGAYKHVYCVDNHIYHRQEAISIMNLRSLKENDCLDICRQEIECSFLLSELNEKHICPFFLTTYQAFRTTYNAPSAWRKGTTTEGSTSSPTDDYLYIRMELANSNNMEDYLRELATASFDPALILPLFIQMVLSLYIGHQMIGLYHYDVKLLNFFLTKEPSISTDCYYTFTFPAFSISYLLPQDSLFLVKLADFGTALYGRPDQDPQPLTIGQFTTLENTPIDYFLEGTQNKIDSNHDRWCLGLALLHLLTGHVPYEEILAPIHCPLDLKKVLKPLWQSCRGKRKTMFQELKIVMRDYESDLLYDTFYRYLVLFDIDPHTYKENEILSVLFPLLYKESEIDPSKRERQPTKLQTKFAQDQSVYSYRKGTHPYLQQARELAAQLNHVDSLMLKLLSTDYKHRPSYEEIMRDPALQLTYDLSQRPNVEKKEYIFTESLFDTFKHDVL